MTIKLAKGKLAISLLLFLLVICLPNLSMAAYEIPLSSGWNLISLPEQQSNTDIEIVTVSIEGQFISIWTYENGSWSTYVPSSPGFTTLEQMDAGRAYWIDMGYSSGTLVGSGFKPSSSIQVDSGWNFIGYNGNSDKGIAEALNSIEGSVDSVWSFIDDVWKVYYPDNPGLSNLETMEIGRGYWVKTDSSGTLSWDLDILDTTKVFAESSGSVIVSVTDDQISFQGSSAFLDALSIGDIICDGPSSEAPDGFLRKITSVQRSGDDVTVDTVPASLEEAIRSGVAGGTVELTKNNINWARTKLGPRSKFIASNILGNGSWGIELNEDLGNGVTILGEIYLQPVFTTNLEITWPCHLRQFYCAFTINEHAYIQVKGEWELASFNEWKKIPGVEFWMNPITFFIGPFPVVLTPRITFWVGAQGEIVACVTTEVRQEASCTAGIEYLEGTWYPIKSFDNDFSIVGTASLEASLTAKAGPQLDVMLYGLGGPFVKVYGLGKFVARVSAGEQTRQELDWGIYAGVNLDLGVRANEHLGFDLEWGPFTYQIVNPLLKLYPPEDGYAIGEVKNTAGEPLYGVKVLAIKNDYEEDTQTDGNGNYSLSLPAATNYQLRFSKTGYRTEKIDDVTIQTGQTTSLRAIVLQLEVEEKGNFQGTITNAFTGDPVPGLLVEFRSGIDNYDGGIYRWSWTDNNGQYEVLNADAGYYTGKMAASGYIDGYFTASCVGGETTYSQDGAISPVIDDREVRIVLTWGEIPRDLDSHLTGPEADTAGRFHIYYSNKTYYYNGEIYADLDLDDVSSYGPETTTIYQQSDGVYRFSVHDYTNRNSSTSSALSQSSARVDIYKGNVMMKNYDVPAQPGTLWTVFELNGSNLTDIGTMEFHSDPGTVTAVRMHSDVELMTDLPEKSERLNVQQ